MYSHAFRLVEQSNHLINPTNEHPAWYILRLLPWWHKKHQWIVTFAWNSFLVSGYFSTSWSSRGNSCVAMDDPNLIAFNTCDINTEGNCYRKQTVITLYSDHHCNPYRHVQTARLACSKCTSEINNKQTTIFRAPNYQPYNIITALLHIQSKFNKFQGHSQDRCVITEYVMCTKDRQYKHSQRTQIMYR